jgi:hypothetical protein
MVTRSRASIEDKIAALRLFSDKVTDIKDTLEELEQEAANKLDGLIKSADFAISEITVNVPVGTVFLLTGYFEKEWKLSIPFTDFEAARRFLKKGIKDPWVWSDRAIERTDLWAFTIEKWVPTSDGETQNIVTWHLGHEGIIWFADINEEIDHLKQLAEDGEFLSVSNHYWNTLSLLTVPYKPGDIVTIDYRPEQDVYYAVIAEINDINDGRDCCSIQVIYFAKDGELRQESLKHDLVAIPMFTCMYRLERFTGELPSCEAPLKKVSEILKRDPSLGVSDYEGDFFSRTRFTDNLKNYLPDALDIGDVIRIVKYYGKFDALAHVDYFAVIADTGIDTDDVTVIIHKVCEFIENKLYKTVLKHELGNLTRYYFEKCTDDDFEESWLRVLGKKLKRNPLLADDEEFLWSVLKDAGKFVYDKT